MMNITGMSWQHVCLPLKSYLVDVDDHAYFMTLMSSHAGDGAVEVTLVMVLPRRLGRSAM
jgi:hypothetical protein